MAIYLGPPLPTASSGAFSRNRADGQPLFLGLAPSRGLPSQHLSMLLVRSYRTFAPLPVPGGIPIGPSAGCFCGTLLTVTRTGRYPASLAIWEPGLSSIGSKGSDRNHLACFQTSSCRLGIICSEGSTLPLPWGCSSAG